MQHETLDWILNQKKNISGGSGKIQIKSEIYLTVMYYR